MELPNQNLMKIKQIKACCLIYFSKDPKKSQILKQIETDVQQCTLVHAEDVGECQEALKNSLRAVIVLDHDQSETLMR